MDCHYSSRTGTPLKSTVPSEKCRRTHVVLGILVAWLTASACNRDASSVALARTEPIALAFVSASDSLHNTQVRVVEIGSAAGDQPYLFHNVVGATKLSDGRIVVADGGSREIRFFNEDGQHLQTIGRKGEGPGEFQDLSILTRCPGDSLLAYDVLADRVTTFTSSGELVRHQPVGEYGSILGLKQAQCGPHHRVELYRRIGAASQGIGAYTVPNAVRVTDHFDTVTLATDIAGDDRYRFGATDAPRPLGSYTHIALSGDLLFFGNGDSNRIEMRALSEPGAAKRSLISWSGHSRIVTKQIISEYVQEQTRNIESSSRAARYARDLYSVDYPDSLPSYDRLIAAPGGVWVRNFLLPLHDAADWAFVDCTGRITRSLSLPRHVIPLEIGNTYVLLVLTDEIGVESLRLEDFPTPHEATPECGSIHPPSPMGSHQRVDLRKDEQRRQIIPAPASSDMVQHIVE